MKVLVLGGTGAMGMHLVEILSDAGIETFVTSRSRHVSSKFNVKYMQGDAHDLMFLNKILREHWDVIVDFMAYSTEEFIERVDLLLKATSQYVFLSSARVYANSETIITEETPRLLDVSTDKEYLTTDEYALTKARQENVLRTSKYKNWTIIRPYITYSEIRFQLGVLEKEAWLYRALNGRTIVFSDDIACKYTTLTHGLDVARGICKVVGNSEVLGETFHITTTKSCRWNDILFIYLDVLKNKIGCCPKVLMLDKSMNLNYDYLKYQVLYDRYYDRRFDNTKISKFIDIDSFKNAELGIRLCLETPKFNTINWRTEALKDKLTGERTLLKEIPTLKQKVKYLLYRYVFLS